MSVWVRNSADLCNGPSIFDHLNEACLWTSGYAAIRDEFKIQPLVFPELLNKHREQRGESAEVPTCPQSCFSYIATQYIIYALYLFKE